MSEHVWIESKGGLLAITLTRPERRNAITVAMYAALADAIEQGGDRRAADQLAAEGEISPRQRSADFMAAMRATARRSPWAPASRLADNADTCRRRTWQCVGIGTTLLLHCDLVLAEEGTRFSLPFVDLGLVPEAASSLLMPRLAGRRRAARYLLMAEPFGPQEAYGWGLVSHVVAKGDLDAKLAETVAALLAKPAAALRMTQKLLRHGNRDEILERFEMENGHFAKRLQSAEVKEAITAFFEKRKPDYTGLG